jgi:predicted Zn-dependent peptidase
MKKSTIAILAISLLSLTEARFRAQDSQSTKANFAWEQKTSAGYSYRTVSNDPTATRFYTLKNGLTVILSVDKHKPRIQNYIVTKAGSKHDPKNNTGLAHYLEHMLFKGTPKFGSLNWAKEKPLLDQIDALYEQYNHSKDPKKRAIIYKKIDSTSYIASQYAIAGEYDLAMKKAGSNGSNAFTTEDCTTYTENISSAMTDRFLSIQSERFRQPVFRLFHTELETVYEEKNISIDKDSELAQELIFKKLFPTHTYGLQTTLGSVEHLKNPSLLEIKKYYEKYYVPNNMAVIMVGDFNPDDVVAKVDAAFAYMQPKAINDAPWPIEAEITTPIMAKTTGPEAENMLLAYRLPGSKDQSKALQILIAELLSNEKAGLIDLNLVQKQKVSSAGLMHMEMKDYNVFEFYAQNKMGQNLKACETLLLQEIEKLRQGQFDESMIQSAINNIKKREIYKLESINGKAELLNANFVKDEDWLAQINLISTLQKLGKADVVAFAQQHLKPNNYAAVYKNKGPRAKTDKIEKPKINAVETNAGQSSDFVKNIDKIPSTPIQPKFVDYQKDLQKDQIHQSPLLYVQNQENELFRLNYRYKHGYFNDHMLPFLQEILPFLGDGKHSNEALTKAFYALGCSYQINIEQAYSTVTIEGLQSNFKQALQLYENFVKNCPKGQISPAVMQDIKANILKNRADAKSDKQRISNGLFYYGVYGAKNPFNQVANDQEIKNLNADALIGKWQNLNATPHEILYYGPAPINELKNELTQLHPATTAQPQAMATVFKPIKYQQNEVLLVNHNSIQADLYWINSPASYDVKNTAVIELYNDYFGAGGMECLVFQEIRERKALAYAAQSALYLPADNNKTYLYNSYIGTQADKFPEAISSMDALVKNMPLDANKLALVKQSVKEQLATQRTEKDGIIYHYLYHQNLGNKNNPWPKIYEEINQIDINQLGEFQKNHIANQAVCYAILGNEKKLDPKKLKSLGKIKKLSLKDIFGY